MLKGYNDRWDGKPVNYKNCLTLTGYKYFNLLAVTGVRVIEDKHPLLWHNIEGKYPSPIKIKVKCSRGVELRRILNVANKSLRNDLFKGPNLARQIFEEQITRAQEMGVKTFRITAYRDPYKATWNGYRIWPWYGYTMAPSSREAFLSFLDDHFLPEMTIHELYKLKPDPNHPFLTKGGYQLWKEKGSTWHGVFDLEPNSENFKLYNEFKSKNI